MPGADFYACPFEAHDTVKAAFEAIRDGDTDFNCVRVWVNGNPEPFHGVPTAVKDEHVTLRRVDDEGDAEGVVAIPYTGIGAVICQKKLFLVTPTLLESLQRRAKH